MVLGLEPGSGSGPGSVQGWERGLVEEVRVDMLVGGGG